MFPSDGLLAGIETKVNTDYFEDREYWNNVAEKIVFTDKVDEFYDYQFGKLEYRTVRFVIMCNNKISSYNIFLMNYKYFDEYCSWLFSVLQECEKRININNYNSFQYRIWGYMAERLFNVWLNKNIKNIKSLNIVFFTDNPKENELKMIFKAIRNSLSAKLLNRSQKQNFHLTEDEEKYIKLISQ